MTYGNAVEKGLEGIFGLEEIIEKVREIYGRRFCEAKIGVPCG
jgi:hypothetical protein